MGGNKGETLRKREKEKDVRESNILAAKAVSDAVRTSLGPRGMDKMIQGDDGEVIITNDGATILTRMKCLHPAAKMMQELSKSQDIEAGDGTTSVVVLAGAILASTHQLLKKGIHPTVIAEAFLDASQQAERILEGISRPVSLSDRESLIQAATTSLCSKVVSTESQILAPIAVDATLQVIDKEVSCNVDINENIRIVQQVGGTVEDTELVNGLVFKQKSTGVSGAPKRVENAKIGLIQFCLSAPKTDIENNVVVSEYAAMDRILREERKYILKLCKKIKDSGCNVLLVQKSILRDATNDLSLHFLAKMKIMVIKDVERTDIEFISRTVGCLPVAHVDSFLPEKLGHAKLVEEVSLGSGRVIKVTGCPNSGKTVTVLCRGSNKLVLGEADRSLHDALCVVRCLVKKRFLIVGGGAPEAELALRLSQYAKTLKGQSQFCVKAFAEALEVVPYTLAENAGLNPINIVTELRRQHAEGCATAGINVRTGKITDLAEENIFQPLLVSTSAISLASETVRMILKIDDMVGAI
uniref:T-complex protein 1 subunit delta n=1 Tax=Mucochytrium quahogii TaxID=96639 RepID=A0A7S2W2D7_9STRA|mmetsp:Transcript_10700/g.23147  ORF Transcript_10700/g.23147 Transcript_10700/m.23147 type:complete len:527 (+) Transcript_10700:46-1626(+)